MMTQADISKRLLNQISSLISQLSSLTDIINELNEENDRLRDRVIRLEVEKVKLIKGEVDQCTYCAQNGDCDVLVPEHPCKHRIIKEN